MAENITNYRAGKTLVEVLQQQGIKSQVIQQITGLVADLLEEAVAAAKSHNAQKQQQEQQQQPPPGSIRDVQGADAVLQGLSLVAPRGKFDCAFFGDCMQITNKQTSALIPYGAIQHVLIIDAVPKQPNQTYMVLVMTSGQPVRQGKNLLDLVVLQTKDQPELSIPAPSVCQHLGPKLVGPAAVVLSQLLASYIEHISDDTFLTADSSVFSSSAGDLMVAANKGAQAGWLVPLSAGLCYVGKQGSFMPRSGISRMLFHRTGAGSATFDITIKLPGAGQSLELGQIDAAELPKLQGYCLSQRIKMGGDDEDSEEEAAGGAAVADTAGGVGPAHSDDDDDDEDDEDFDPDAAGPQQQPTKRRRVDGGEVQEAGDAGQPESGDEDDDEEDEEDYEGGSDSSSDPELVPSGELSDMEDDGLGDFE